eukprot:g29497.t1
MCIGLQKYRSTVNSLQCHPHGTIFGPKYLGMLDILLLSGHLACWPFRSPQAFSPLAVSAPDPLVIPAPLGTHWPSPLRSGRTDHPCFTPALGCSDGVTTTLMMSPLLQ